MGSDPDKSLSDEATSAGAAKRRPASEVSLGDERTLGDNRSGHDTVTDDIEVIDLEARYRVEGTLGQGGMGAVLLATDTRLDRKVAIKRILGEAAGNRMAVQRFLTEAKAIAALNHPNIVQIYDYGRAKDGPFLIMEYVDGGSLLDRCRDSALPLDEAIDLACQLCDGLAKAHDLGIIHRDIKPANVLLTKDGIPKLTDFGLAKAQAGDHGQTMTGAVLGTPDFMPPEQRRDASLVDHRSDLWSLAATVYQMATGRSPKIIRFDLLPSELTKVLGKALEDAKDARYQSAREFRDALKANLRFSGPMAAEVVGEGQCPACGVQNPDLKRKFCRNPQCGASLRQACLQCDAQMPVWEAICGDCGTNQLKKLEEKRATLEATRATAEERLAEHAFDAAAALADELAAISLPQLADLADWGRSFAERIAQERTRQEECAAEKLREAEAHRKAFDYPAAIAAIEAIPQRLLTVAAAQLLAACEQNHADATRLIETIATRIGRKEIDGLLPVVDRAIALRGDRQDLAKIRGQLVERLEGRITRARAALAAGDAAAAAKALAGAAIEDLGEEVALLDQVTRAAEAEERLLGFVKDAKSDGIVNADEARKILEAGEECLAVNPASQKAASLVAQAQGIVDQDKRRAEERRQRHSARRDVLREEAHAAIHRKDYTTARARLDEIDPDVMTNDLRTLSRDVDARMQRMALLREEMKAAVAGQQYDGLLEKVDEYPTLHPSSPDVEKLRSSLQKRAERLAAEKEAEEALAARQRAERVAELTARVADLRAQADRRETIRNSAAFLVATLASIGMFAFCVLTTIWPAGDLSQEPRLDFRNIFQALFGGLGLGLFTWVATAIVVEIVVNVVFMLCATSRASSSQTSEAHSEHLTSLPDLENSIGIKMKQIPAGLFIMGDGGFQQKYRVVSLTQPYFIGVYEVTNAEWEKVMGSMPSDWKEGNRPVVQVSWDDAVMFCETLSALPEEKKAGRVYRLPTEAEWEYACRAGSTTTYSFGDDYKQLGEYGWFGIKNCFGGNTHPVGQKTPNAWGLYDMHGNVAEWCSDWHGDFGTDAATDPTGPHNGSERVIRGGDWCDFASACQAATREKNKPSHRSNSIGFRVAMTAATPRLPDAAGH